jgi:DNA-binding transcriptional LysR family regulator
MQINDLLIFQAAAEYGSFTKAAAATNTGQSNVTARIKSLEAEFNARLFHRTSRTITLTEAGEELLRTTKEIILLLDTTRKSISGEDMAVKGTVKIGCIHTTAALRVPGILQSFSEEYPEVEFKLQTGTTSSLIKAVLACQLDGAFVAGDIADDRLLAQPVISEELGIVTSSLVSSYDQLRNGKKKLKLIVFNDGCSYRKHFESIIKEWELNQVSLIEMDTLEGIINAIENNIGITLLPIELIKRHYKYKAVKVFPLPEEFSRMTTIFIKRKDSSSSTAYQKFLDLLAKGYNTAIYFPV